MKIEDLTMEQIRGVLDKGLVATTEVVDSQLRHLVQSHMIKLCLENKTQEESINFLQGILYGFAFREAAHQEAEEAFSAFSHGDPDAN